MSRVRLSPWLIALAALSLLLGESAYLWAGLCCVLVHEWGHALCARALGLAVEGMEIAPFGGVVYVRGVEQLGTGAAVGVALAGPATSLALAGLCGCAAYALPKFLPFWARLIEINLVLALTNLLPAFPLDGGRVLCALLRRRAGLARAQRIASGTGIAMGLALMVLGLFALHAVGKCNLTLLLCGGYVIFASGREMRGTPFSVLQVMAGRGEELRRRRVLPVRTIAVREGTTDAEVYSRLLPGALYRIVYLDEDLRAARCAWEMELLGGVYKKARPLGQGAHTEAKSGGRAGAPARTGAREGGHAEREQDRQADPLRGR